MMQIYKYQCGIFENIRMNTENDGTVLAIMADPAASKYGIVYDFYRVLVFKNHRFL